MSESNEPSYYEVALTNRQVLVAFVILLCCVLAAFVSGVWVGRKGSDPPEEGGEQVAAADTAAGDLEELEEFKFFSDQEEGEGSGGDPKAAAATPEADTTLAEDVGSKPPPRAAPPPPRAAPAPPPPRAAPAPPPSRPAPPPPVASTTVTAPAQPKDGFVIQVLSTRDEARANRILNQLVQGSYPAFLSPVKVGSQVNYRVRIGPYPDRPPAEKAARAVTSKYKLETWITAASN